MTKEQFLFHYGCEWDTNEFLGWDEVWICIEQTILAENKRLREALDKIVGTNFTIGSHCYNCCSLQPIAEQALKEEK
jgi:hypothetical protein